VSNPTSNPFHTLLIANRGEIACRVIATARRMGLRSVAVFSDADAGAKHVAMADEAVRIGPAAASESYLDIEAILEAARTSGAQAIHPGYGFLSENPRFVEAVEAVGLVFVGPSAQSIRAMGLKDAAKRLMEEAGVPVVPGYHGDAQETVILAGKASEIGYPVLIKAAAGGGGKGMRLVEKPEDFREALASAKREARAAFGDERVLVEKFVAKPRHIEVQVFGDSHGNVVHLFERDCSAQRRHQKVIEEAPAPGMTQEMRKAMTDAAVRAARAISYRGAGTVEFIVDASRGLRPDGFWFMEMNTRLQVEHPVTEMITGLDLVEWQLRVAAGEKLPLRQEEIRLGGHAFEARIYAEDPARGFLPATGTLHMLDFPDDARVDSGVRQGDSVTPHYDPMIAKLIVHGADRASALAALVRALEATRIAGSVTNTAFLARLARLDAFAAGDVDTGLIGREFEAIAARRPAPQEASAVAALVSLGLLEDRRPANAFDLAGPFSLWGAPAWHAGMSHGGERADMRVSPGEGGYALSGQAGEIRLRDIRLDGGGIAARGPGGPFCASFVRWPGHVTVFLDGEGHDFALDDPLAGGGETEGGGDRVLSPMPGMVRLAHRKAGDRVKRGEALLVLEAMKMEHTLAAPRDGVLARVASAGDQVQEGAVLALLEAQEGA
jgi:3-methylcrotonyl-CoA carboxylase alpha subunit